MWSHTLPMFWVQLTMPEVTSHSHMSSSSKIWILTVLVLDYLLIKLTLHETIFLSWKVALFSMSTQVLRCIITITSQLLGCTRTLRHEPEFSWQSPTIQLHALCPHFLHTIFNSGVNPACTSHSQPCKPLTTSFMPIREQLFHVTAEAKFHTFKFLPTNVLKLIPAYYVCNDNKHLWFLAFLQVLWWVARSCHSP